MVITKVYLDVILCWGGHQLLMAEATNTRIKSLSAGSRWSMPSSTDDTIEDTGKLFGVMAKLKLRLIALLGT